jgi:thioredoxin 1
MLKPFSLLPIVFATLILIGAGCDTRTHMSTPMETAPSAIATPTAMVASGTAMRAMPENTPTTNTPEQVMEKKAPIKPPEEQMTPPVTATGSYEVYDASKLNRAKTGTVVLFFYAPWCPTCRAVDADINARLNSLPNNFSLLKVDYDSSTDLKQKYGVTYQHTFVQVDDQGTMLKKWSGGSTLASILDQVSR